MSTYRGVSFVDRPTAYDVEIGDRVVCMLSDAVAAVEVTSITYRDLDLTRHGLGHVVHVVFGYSCAPWWVDQQMMSGEISTPVPVRTEDPS